MDRDAGGASSVLLRLRIRLGVLRVWGHRVLTHLWPDRGIGTLSALHESEARFRGAFDRSAVAAAITSPAGTWLRVNEALCEMLGYAERELVGRTFQSLSHPDDIAPNLELLHRALTGEIDRYEMEKRLVHAQGHVVWVRLNAAAVRDATGSALYLIAQFQDVTEHRRAMIQLRASEERHRRVVETANEGICTVDAAGTITYANARLGRMLGDASAALVGRTLFEFMDPHAAFEARTRFARHQRGIAEVLELELRRADGSTLLAQQSTSSLFDSDGRFAGAVYLLTDVSDQRRAALRLAESEQRYRSLFDHNPDAVYSFDTSGTFLSTNAAGERLTGYSREALVGRPFAPLIPAEHLDATLEHFRAAAAGQATSYVSALRDATGRQVEVAVANVPIVVDGAVVGVYGIVNDLTAQRELQAQLRQAQKMEAVGRLAGGVAHDFNNILTVIKAYTSMALGALPPDAAVSVDLREIELAAGRAAALTRQLLAFSRRQVLQPRRLDVNRVVGDVAGMLRRVIGEDITLQTDLPARVWPIHADPGQLEQMLMNLAVNARDAMPGGGTLRLRTANVTVDAAAQRRREGLAPGEYAAIYVEDTGAGIGPEVLPQIFEPFFTTKAPGHGTGLGLATVYGIVKQSGGFVYVDSTRGQGSCFTVLLPRTELDGEEDVLAPAVPLARGTETILLVEDEAALRSVARRMLERQGYTVLEAGSGREADRVAAGAERLGTRVDLLLTDVVMPDESGRALAECLAARRPGLRVLFMSGYTDDEILRRGLMKPGAEFLEKPFTVERLAEAVRRVLDTPFTIRRT